jgi:hypothetical protein
MSGNTPDLYHTGPGFVLGGFKSDRTGYIYIYIYIYIEQSRNCSVLDCLRVLDDVNVQTLIRPGHESSTGSVQLIRRWGPIMGSILGATHW